MPAPYETPTPERQSRKRVVQRVPDSGSAAGGRPVGDLGNNRLPSRERLGVAVQDERDLRPPRPGTGSTSQPPRPGWAPGQKSPCSRSTARGSLVRGILVRTPLGLRNPVIPWSRGDDRRRHRIGLEPTTKTRKGISAAGPRQRPAAGHLARAAHPNPGNRPDQPTKIDSD